MDGATGRNCGVRIEDLAMLCKPARVVLIPLELEDNDYGQIDDNASEEKLNKFNDSVLAKKKYTLSKTKRVKKKKCEIEYVECELNDTERRIIELIEANNFEDYGPAVDYEQNPTLYETKLRKNKKRKTENVECKLNYTEQRIIELIEANNFEDYDRPLPPGLTFDPDNLYPEPGSNCTTRVKYLNKQCRYCEAKFKRSENLKNHERTHNEYDSKDELKNPRWKSKQLTSICTQCDATLVGNVAIRAHELFHKEGVKYTCQPCQFGFELKTSFNYHNQTKHNDVEKYVCKFCGVRFKIRTVWSTHLRIHATNQRFPCETCGSVFRLQSSLYRHIKTHNRSGGYTCAVCGQTFATLFGCRSHEGRYHPSLSEEVKCRFCGKSFKRASYLRLHLAIHTGDLPFKCQNCPKGFPIRGLLNRHIETAHGGESGKVQCEHCGNLFKNKDSLVRHVKYEHSADGEVQVVCDKCGKMIRKKHLKYHEKTHVEKTFKCNQCSFVANTSRGMKDHSFTHSKEKRYRCTSCTASYRSPITLKKHNLTHNVNEKNDSNSLSKN